MNMHHISWSNAASMFAIEISAWSWSHTHFPVVYQFIPTFRHVRVAKVPKKYLYSGSKVPPKITFGNFPNIKALKN